MAVSTIPTALPSSPTLTTTGISIVSSRGSIQSGGILKMGKWRFVHLLIKLSTSFSANNYWAILQGFDAPLGNQAAIAACAVNKSGGAISAYISDNGLLTIATDNAQLASGDLIALSGWYLTA